MRHNAESQTHGETNAKREAGSFFFETLKTSTQLSWLKKRVCGIKCRMSVWSIPATLPCSCVPLCRVCRTTRKPLHPRAQHPNVLPVQRLPTLGTIPKRIVPRRKDATNRQCATPIVAQRHACRANCTIEIHPSLVAKKHCVLAVVQGEDLTVQPNPLCVRVRRTPRTCLPSLDPRVRRGYRMRRRSSFTTV